MPRQGGRFRVRTRHEDSHHGRVVEEATFEAAAMAYVEHMPAAAGQPSAVQVVVHDRETGHEHSFLVHLDNGAITVDEGTN